MPAPAFQSYTSATGGSSTTNLTANKPSGVVAGDMLLAVVDSRGSTTKTITPPTGWTSIAKVGSATPATSEVFWKIAGGSEPATYHFSWDSAGYSELVIVHVTGANATPIDVSASEARSPVQGPVCPSVTTTVADCLLFRIACGFGAGSARTYTEPAGTTSRWQVFSGMSGASGTLGATSEQAAAGATGTATFSYSGTQNQETAVYTVAIAPAASGGSFIDNTRNYLNCILGGVL